MIVTEDWHLKEPAAARPTLVCEVVLQSTGERLTLSVWRTSLVPLRFKGLVEWRNSLNVQEHPDFSGWEAAVAWCTRTAEALDVLR